MKKIFKLMFAVAAGLAAMTACTNEPEENITPAQKDGYVIVTASLGDQTRNTLTDEEGIKWEEGDQIKYAGGWEGTSEPLTAEDIEDGGYTAHFKFPAALNEVDRTGWFVSTKCHPGNYNEVEFTLGSANGAAYAQEAAGKMNSRYLFLHSGTGITSIKKDEAPSVTMNIVGSIFRLIPYTETYNNETIEYVELSAKGGNGIVGTVAYDRGAGTYRGVNDVNWQKFSTVHIDLTEPFALEGVNSREKSKGIYMALAATTEAHPISDYTITVRTDVADYTFDSKEPLVIKENELKNVFLKLENAARIDLNAYRGELQYIGDLADATNTPISFDGVENKYGGYWYAQTRDAGSNDWVTREGASGKAFYDNVVFTYTDEAGEPVDWISVVYGGGGGTHWMLTVQPNTGAERKAVITATFPDVEGYVVVDECKTKTITVTQNAYSETAILGFYGGIGDQTLPGEGVNKQSLGYCVIQVNGVNAESWGDNKHNEQELYGNVVIECREGAANGPIVDWLTVEYGKDAEGKFNSTHLLATATENTTGAERKALVCCTYNAPEGYKFENGQTSFFRQFMVTQKASGAVKVISFWGGIGAEFNHDANAQQDWGLSYWVVSVDGINATDWGGDSHNEQAIYGGAEFKCYDYTNGVRGEEIDWVTVEYKKDGNGKVIDTWWLADIEANTGAARAAEIVCTFPALEGYSYDNNQNVKSTIIRQAAGEQSGNEGGNEEGGETTGTISYTLFNNALDGSNTTGFGPGAGPVGDWYRFENVTYNGKTYTPGDELKNFAASAEMANLMAQAFEFGTLTEADVQVPGVDPLTTNPEEFVTLEAWCDGGAAIYVRIILSANDSGARRTFKIITKDAAGEQLSSIVYFQNI